MLQEQINHLEAEIKSWQRKAEAKKAEADAYKDKCFLMWQSADMSYCFCLQQITKLEKELELVRAGWGSITA